MKKKTILIITNITIILMVIVTLSVLLYPTISNYINGMNQSKVVERYVDEVAGMKDEDKQELLDSAYKYNQELLKRKSRFVFTKKDVDEYQGQLNTKNGVLGILTVDKINVHLPIYHGSNEVVLQVGLGHIQGTSLPVGGVGTHAFITGHRGLPSSTLLTNLDKMVEGDTFTLFVLGETLTYQVDQIKTVKPEELNVLDIDSDSDYCTLVTCTPYGINSHRLLVRGHRVENAPSVGIEGNYEDAKQLDKGLIILLFIVPILPALIIFVIIKCRKIHKGGNASL